MSGVMTETSEVCSIAAPRVERTKWTPKRIARLGFLVGQGLSAKQIATDLLIASTEGNVSRQIQRHGLSFREASRLPFDVRLILDLAAGHRQITRNELSDRILTAAARDGLINAVLDDQEKSK